MTQIQPIPIRPGTEPPGPAQGPGKTDKLMRVVAWALVAIGLVVVSAGVTYYAVVNSWLEPLTGTVYTEAEHRAGLEGAQGRGEVVGRSAGIAIGAERGLAVGRGAGEDEGYGRGYTEGEDQGYRRGVVDGYDEGYQDGRGTGESMGRTTAYDDGFAEGESIGWNDGYASGLTDGYDNGWSEGCRAVFSALGANRVVDYRYYDWELTGASYVSRATC